MLHGWWRVSGVQELHSLVKALHSRGIREKVLQKQFQKHMEYVTQLCANSKDGESTTPLLTLILFNRKHTVMWSFHVTCSQINMYTYVAFHRQSFAVLFVCICGGSVWCGRAGETGSEWEDSGELVCGGAGHGGGHQPPAAGGGSGEESRLRRSADQGKSRSCTFVHLQLLQIQISQIKFRCNFKTISPGCAQIGFRILTVSPDNIFPYCVPQGWMQPEPQSEREDLIYQEHKLLSSPAPENKWQRETSPEKLPGSVVRRPDNPLDIAVMRLAELEGNIERRYLQRNTHSDQTE